LAPLVRSAPAALLLVMVLAASCTGEKQPVPSPTAIVPANIRDLMAQDKDTPKGLAQFGPPNVRTPEEMFSGQVASGRATQEDLQRWGTVQVAFQAFGSSSPFPLDTPKKMQYTVTLHSTSEGAASFFEYVRGNPTRADIEGLESQLEREIATYEDDNERRFGDESRYIHYTSRNPDDPYNIETYYVLFRRLNAVGVLQVVAVQDETNAGAIAQLINTLDERLRENLS
jgi:hypothetical protein